MVSPIYFEVAQLIAFVAVLVCAVVDSRRCGELGSVALLAIAGLSIFWQEFYADWGAYLLWNRDFHMLPWGASPLTTPGKPAMNVYAYPVFMTTAFISMLTLQRWARHRWPRAHPLLLSLVTAGPVLIGFNVVTEYISVATLGFWTYVNTLGLLCIPTPGRCHCCTRTFPSGCLGRLRRF